MRYTVINIEPERQVYADQVHNVMQGHEYVPIQPVDARVPEQMLAAKEKHPYNVKTDLWTPKAGHIGVWYSMLNVWEQGGPIIHFEDDSLVNAHFHSLFEQRLEQMPKDADFMSLFLPRDSYHLYDPSRHRVTEDLARPFNTYGGVSMYFTERGIEKIHALVKEQGIWCQWDDWLYRQCSNYRLNGYVPTPDAAEIVTIYVLESLAQNGPQYVG